MSMRSFSAPGKVMLSGEYAVLRGAPAVVMAVDRRARVTVGPEGDAVRCIGTDGPTDSTLLDRVLDALQRQRPAAELTLDTAVFRDASAKLGVGSSAALAAALTVALATDEMLAADRMRAAFEAHRNFQSGKGSGADVAASFMGGIIVYRMRDAETQSIVWPAGLEYAVFWSGRPVKTGDRIRRFDDSAPHATTAALCDASEDLAAIWASGGARQVLNGYGAYLEALTDFDRAHSLGIFDGGHAALATSGRDLIYKPCGAGGGDIGIALSTDPNRLARFAADASKQGTQKLEVSLDPRGAGEDATGA